MEDRCISRSSSNGDLEKKEKKNDRGGKKRKRKKACEACTAGVIADCVAVCCCPCALLSIITLAFVRLPWALATRLLAKATSKSEARGGATAETPPESNDEEGIGRSYHFSAAAPVAAAASVAVAGESNDDDVWLEVGHLGFGRLSFTGLDGCWVARA